MFNRAGAIAGELFDADLQYIGATVNTANQTNYTFSGVDIGVASDDRIVIVGSAHNFGCTSITIDGVATTLVARGNCGLGYLSVPSGTTADIVVSTNGGTNQNCRIWVYTMQSVSGIPLTHVGENDGDTASLSVSGIETRPNGGLVCVAQFNDGGGFTETWSGPETITEDQNGLSETSIRQMAHSINTEQFTLSGEFTITRLSGTSAIRLIVITF